MESRNELGHGLVRPGLVGRGEAGRGAAGILLRLTRRNCGLARLGMVGSGLAWQCGVGPGMARLGEARQGKAGN